MLSESIKGHCNVFDQTFAVLADVGACGAGFEVVAAGVAVKTGTATSRAAG